MSPKMEASDGVGAGAAAEDCAIVDSAAAAAAGTGRCGELLYRVTKTTMETGREGLDCRRGDGGLLRLQYVA